MRQTTAGKVSSERGYKAAFARRGGRAPTIHVATKVSLSRRAVLVTTERLRSQTLTAADWPSSFVRTGRPAPPHLERLGFVVMKRPPIGGASALGRGFEGRQRGG